MTAALFFILALAALQATPSPRDGADGTWMHPTIPFSRGESRYLEQLDAAGRLSCVAIGTNADFQHMADAQCAPLRPIATAPPGAEIQ